MHPEVLLTPDASDIQNVAVGRWAITLEYNATTIRRSQPAVTLIAYGGVAATSAISFVAMGCGQSASVFGISRWDRLSDSDSLTCFASTVNSQSVQT